MTFWEFAHEHTVALCIALFIVAACIHDTVEAWRKR